jgi:hypothetical protein
MWGSQYDTVHLPHAADDIARNVFANPDKMHVRNIKSAFIVRTLSHEKPEHL